MPKFLREVQGNEVPVASKVTIKVNRQCSKCDNEMAIGSVVVKDRQSGEVQYCHTECPKKGKSTGGRNRPK
jgi:hypothetical protein